MIKSNNWTRILSFSIALTIALALLSHTRLFKVWELKTLDFRFFLRGQEQADSRTFLVGIDDQSVEHLGRWPWSRKYHAALLKTFSNHPPRAVGFDVVFSQRSKEADDQALVNASRLLDDLVYGAYFRSEPIVTKQETKDDLLIKASVGDAGKGQYASFKVAEPELPFDELARAADFAFVNAPRDIDGTVRRIPLIIPYQNKLYPSFALKLVLNYFDVSQISVSFGKSVEFGDRSIPIDKNGNFLVNFRSSVKDFSRANFIDLLLAAKREREKKGEEALLKTIENKIVLVGLMMTGTSDQDPTPLDSQTPLFLVHANAIQNVINNDYLRSLGQYVHLIVLFLIIFVCYLGRRVSVFIAGVGTGLVFILYCLINFLSFHLWSLWLPFVIPAIAIIIAYLYSSSYRFFIEETKRRHIKRAFQKFVSPAVLKNVLENPEMLKLGGEDKLITILFSDIFSFSTYCENRKPEKVVEILNEYFDAMTNIVLEEGGTLDKYMGDGLMAIFGAPKVEDSKLHAIRAVRVAVKMHQRLRKLHQSWVDRGIEPFEMGVGIHTGHALVGQMGSRAMMHYTAIGDEVNLASRVEGQTRVFHRKIIITESTYQLVRDSFVCERLDVVSVKGRVKPVLLFAVQGEN